MLRHTEDSKKETVIISIKDYVRAAKRAKMEMTPRDVYLMMIENYGTPDLIDDNSNLYWEIPKNAVPEQE